jgi:hypothetical protein
MIVVPQSPSANSNDLVRRLLGFLGKDSQDQDGIDIKTIRQSPRSALVIDPQFMAPSCDRRHWPRLRHAQLLTLLQAP